MKFGRVLKQGTVMFLGVLVATHLFSQNNASLRKPGIIGLVREEDSISRVAPGKITLQRLACTRPLSRAISRAAAEDLYCLLMM